MGIWDKLGDFALRARRDVFGYGRDAVLIGIPASDIRQPEGVRGRLLFDFAADNSGKFVETYVDCEDGETIPIWWFVVPRKPVIVRLMSTTHIAVDLLYGTVLKNRVNPRKGPGQVIGPHFSRIRQLEMANVDVFRMPEFMDVCRV